MNRWHSLPAEVYSLVEQTPAAVLLETAKPAGPIPPVAPHADCVSRLFIAPSRVCVALEPADIPSLFGDIERAVAAGLFAAGFFAYECGQCFEPKAAMRASRDGQPLAWFGIYERCWLFDHLTGRFTDGEPPELAQFRGAGRSARPDASSQASARIEAQIETEFSLTETGYAARIDAIHEWIRAGDIYQLNLTAPFRVRAPGSSAVLYAHLRGRQPVEYGAFLHWQPGRRILSFSPELFFRIDGESACRRITSRPMKGTAPRGRTTREDRESAERLRSDPKNRAENLMIVDLVRNDLGRLCSFGSVRVENLFAVECYPTVWQMTSTVSGELRSNARFEQIFRALFPCGSITGAPKVRAMQLAARVEDGPRGVYTGAIGFFSAERTVFSVAIRTLELNGDSGAMGVGSGIVIDSDAREEFRECLLKAEFLTAPAARRPERFSLIESLLWNGAYPLAYPFIELHLDRLEDSAAYFGFDCEREAARAALLNHAAEFRDAGPRKVRLLLDADGRLRVASEALPVVPADPTSARVRIAPQRTDPSDPMLFHKTTHRPLYTSAFKAAIEAGFDDVLFLNLRGEVTEGAISSIFVEKDGCWFTPPVECGLLAGVYRRHLLETRPEIEERRLSIEDLKTADAVYLANAVRGLRRTKIDWDN
ncbi:MAG: aminodeoxychorismate synthase component I [Terracidiphilus sp.]